jgi:hypothetical protein
MFPVNDPAFKDKLFIVTVTVSVAPGAIVKGMPEMERAELADNTFTSTGVVP